MDTLPGELPSNKKFGLFFGAVFAILSVYFAWQQHAYWGPVFLALCAAFVLIALTRPNLLLPFNRAWMGLGLFLGKVFSPIVLGAMFFGLITPIALFLRLTGRDELRLKKSTSVTHWRIRTTRPDGDTTSFKDQY